jgi:hypothetical protein
MLLPASSVKTLGSSVGYVARSVTARTSARETGAIVTALTIHGATCGRLVGTFQTVQGV